MNTYIVRAALVGLALPLAILPARALQSRASTVTTAVTVRERSGALVSNLTERDFAVEEDGKPQKLTRFTAERTPMSVALVIDASQSLRGQTTQVARDAARQFIDTALRPDDEVVLVSFNHAVTVVANWTKDRNVVRAGLDTIVPSGSTAAYDALFKTMSLFSSRNLQRAAIVMLSNGADSASSKTPAQLKKDLAGTDLFLYWIAIEPPDARPSTLINPQAIAELAAAGNGYSEVIRGNADLGAALTRVSDELNHQYLMSYEPSTPANGNFRTIRVTVPNKNYVVRARRGITR